MRAQVLLSAISTAVLCGLVGIYFLSSAVGRVEDNFLDSELRFGEHGVRRQIEIRRACRGSAYQLIARQPLLRISLMGGDRPQLTTMAQLTRQSGADAVAIVDVASSVLAAEGQLAEQLVATASSQGLGEAATFVVVSGTLMDAYRIPIGADPPVGYLIAADDG